MRSSRKKLGFTLAETLITVGIVIVLLAVVAVAVFVYLRNMTKVEYDGYAKEIFVAAQNHLTIADSQGYLGRSGYGTREPVIPGVADTGDGVWYFTVIPGKDDVRDSSSVLNLMLPVASVDESVRLGGQYVIRYHRDSAQVLDVFYWTDSDSRYAHTYSDADYASFLANREDRDALKTYGAERSVIGYYGGVEARGL